MKPCTLYNFLWIVVDLKNKWNVVNNLTLQSLCSDCLRQTAVLCCWLQCSIKQQSPAYSWRRSWHRDWNVGLFNHQFFSDRELCMYMMSPRTSLGYIIWLKLTILLSQSQQLWLLIYYKAFWQPALSRWDSRMLQYLKKQNQKKKVSSCG